LHGLAQTLALEGRSKNVLVNTIAPIAGSRLTETVMPKELTDALRPEFVMPLVVKLCDENSAETGGLYEVGAGWIGKVRWQRTLGQSFSVNDGFTAEDVNDAWDTISNFEGADNPATINDGTRRIIKNLKK